MQTDLMVDRLEKMANRPLNDEEKYSVDQWYKGRALAQIAITDGWQIAIDMLKSYAADMAEACMNTDPADKENILANHAMAHAAGKIYTLFQQDVNKAIEASRTTPDVVKEGFKRGSPAPAEASL